MWRALSYNPSSTNKVPPYAFGLQQAVTPIPARGFGPIKTLLKAASVNYVDTGAEGGITNTFLYWGTTLDGRDFTYWYSVDWMVINSDINLANAVINGSNNNVNPLYYDQHGIDRLQDVVAATANSAVSVGLAQGQIVKTKLNATDFAVALDAGTYAGKIVVNAVSFSDYLRVNPGDFKIGNYAGLSCQYIPQRGFKAIVFNLFVTDFVAGP